jgi:hypothetical protein
MSAGPFNPLSWEMDTLNWVPDVRMPMFAAQSNHLGESGMPPSLATSAGRLQPSSTWLMVGAKSP